MDPSCCLSPFPCTHPLLPKNSLTPNGRPDTIRQPEQAAPATGRSGCINHDGDEGSVRIPPMDPF